MLKYEVRKTMRDPMNGSSVSFYNVDENVEMEGNGELNDLINNARNHILQHPNMTVIRKQRLERNKSAMKAVSPLIANHVMGEGAISKEESSAICIQRHFRGFLARRLYRDLLYEQFEKEEAERLEKERQQVEEGEVLVDNYHLRQELEEDEVLRRNKRRYEDSSAITIQRVWRNYSAKLHEKLSGLKNGHGSGKTAFNSFLSSPFEDEFYEEDLFQHDTESESHTENYDELSDEHQNNVRTTEEALSERSLSVNSEELSKELPPPVTDWNSIDHCLESDETQSADNQYAPDPKVINRLSAGPDYLQLCFGDNVISEDEDCKEEAEIKEYVIQEYHNDKCEDNQQRDSGCNVKSDVMDLEPLEVKIINPEDLQSSEISPEETKQILMELKSVTKPQEEKRDSNEALRKKLQRFSVRHLDTQIRDLRLRIKEISDVLVEELLIRDQLHTKQDALLMDVEDAVKCAQTRHRLYQNCPK